MTPKQLNLPGPITKQSNDLSRAQLKNGSAIGFRVAVMVASMIRESDTGFHEYEISPSLLTKYNLSSKDLQRMHNAMDDIASTTVSILEGTKYHAWPLFGRATYDDKTKKATVLLNPMIKDHYLQLKSHYTRIPVMEYIQLTSTYTQKLYEYLLSWRSEPKTDIEIRNLHDLLGVPDKYRQDFAQFRRKILEPAHKQINEKTSLSFEYEYLRMTGGRGKGRKITHINFLFSPAMIQATKTPYYKFQQLSKKRQKELHKEFITNFASMPKGVRDTLTWLKDPRSELYINSFKGFLSKHSDFA